MTPVTTTRDAVAAEVRAAMARKRVTQVELAAHMKISRPALSERLSGKRAFNTDELAVICNHLGVDFLSLFPTDPEAVSA